MVAGIRTPKPITQAVREAMGEGGLSLEEALPEVYGQLVEVYRRLEAHYRDMQDIEFTVERACSTCCRPGTANARRKPR